MWNWLADLPLYIQVFFGSVVGTAFMGFVFRLGELIVQNRIERDNERYKDKKALAEQVIALCIEAKSSSFCLAPKDSESTYSIAEKVRIEDETVGELLNTFISAWQVCAAVQKGKKTLTPDEVEFVMYLQKEAKEVSTKLLKMINKWRK